MTTCLYGPLAYIALYFALVLVEFAVRADITRMSETIASESRFISYIEYVATSSLPTVGYLAIAMIVGSMVIPLSAEFAGMLMPSDVARGLSSFYSGMMEKTDKYINEAASLAKQAVGVAKGDVAMAQADKEVKKATQELDFTQPEDYDAPKATNNYAEELADRFWSDRIQETEGNDVDEYDSAIEQMDEYIESVEKGEDKEFMQRYHRRAEDNMRLTEIMDKGLLADSRFSEKDELTQFLKRNGIEDEYTDMRKAVSEYEKTKTQEASDKVRKAKQTLVDKVMTILVGRVETMDKQSVMSWGRAAWRSADHAIAEELMGGDINEEERLMAATQDAEAYEAAVAEGHGDDFIRLRESRKIENQRLVEMTMNGRAPFYLFNGDIDERDKFLKSQGLYAAYRRAEKLMEKSENQSYKSVNKFRSAHSRKVAKYKSELYSNAAERIFKRISEECRDRLWERGAARGSADGHYNTKLRSQYRGLHNIRDGWSIRDGRVQTRVEDNMQVFLGAFLFGRDNMLYQMPSYYWMMKKDGQRERFAQQLAAGQTARNEGTLVEYAQKMIDYHSEEAFNKRVAAGEEPSPGTPDYDRAVGMRKFYQALWSRIQVQPETLQVAVEQFKWSKLDLQDKMDYTD